MHLTNGKTQVEFARCPLPVRVQHESGSPLNLVQDELGRAMNAFPEIAVLFGQKRGSHVGEKMVVLIPI